MLIGGIIIFGIVLFDQVSKILASAFLSTSSDVTIIPSILSFGYHENDGASFGIFSGQQMLFAILTIVALTIFGYFFTKSDFKKAKVYSIGIALLIGGTLGNAIDRVTRGFVVDFLHFPFLGPILELVGLSNFYNNIADIALFAGIILWIIDLLFLESRRKKKEKINLEENS